MKSAVLCTKDLTEGVRGIGTLADVLVDMPPLQSL